MKERLVKKKLVCFKRWANKGYAAFNSLHATVKICTLAVAYSMVATPVKAQTEAGDSVMLSTTQELDDVVIQSTLIELKNAETGRSIEVIQGARIQSLPITTIDELLRYVPGIDAQQRGAFGAQSDFSLRGSNFNQVLVLIDGQKINDPLTAHFNSNIPISPSEIERIEIIRGSASAEYGADATGGVINIISKTFSKNSPEQGLRADAKINAGQYKLINSSAGVFYGNDKFRLSAGGMINKSDGNQLKSGLYNYFNIRNGSLSGQYQFNKNWSAAYRYSNDYRDFNAQWFYTDYASDKAIEKVTRNRNQLQLSRNSEKYSTKFLASYINTTDYYLYAPGLVPTENETGNLSFQAQQSIYISSYVKTTFGGNYEQRTVTSNSRGNHDLSHYAGFITLSLKPIEKLTFNTGIRQDYDDNYGSYFLPQIGLSYWAFDKLVIRGSFGRSIRAADFTENFNSTNTSDTVSKRVPTVGNPFLLPEKSWNSEIGFDYKLSSGILLNVTGFNRQITDLIDYVKTPGSDIHIYDLRFFPTFEYWYAQNNSEASINGIEARISMNKRINRFLSLNFVGGYTYLDVYASYKQSAKYAMLQPKHLVNGNLSISSGRVSWSINGIYKKRSEIYNVSLKENLISSYTVFNTNIDVAIYKMKGFISFSVYNVFDKDYSDFFGAEMPGRWFTGGIKFRI